MLIHLAGEGRGLCTHLHSITQSLYPKLIPTTDREKRWRSSESVTTQNKSVLCCFTVKKSPWNNIHYLSNNIYILEKYCLFVFQQGCIKLMKRDSKVTKYLYFKSMLFFWTFYSSRHPQKNNVVCLHKIWSSTFVFNSNNMRNVTWAVNQHIIMISEGSLWHWRLELMMLGIASKEYITLCSILQ